MEVGEKREAGIAAHQVKIILRHRWSRWSKHWVLRKGTVKKPCQEPLQRTRQINLLNNDQYKKVYVSNFIDWLFQKTWQIRIKLPFLFIQWRSIKQKHCRRGEFLLYFTNGEMNCSTISSNDKKYRNFSEILFDARRKTCRRKKVHNCTISVRSVENFCNWQKIEIQRNALNTEIMLRAKLKDIILLSLSLSFSLPRTHSHTRSLIHTDIHTHTILILSISLLLSLSLSLSPLTLLSISLINKKKKKGERTLRSQLLWPQPHIN